MGRPLGEPGFIAFFVLVAWIPVSLGLFYALPLVRAALLVFFGGMLFLPELAQLDLPSLPPLEKRSITILALLAGTLLRMPRRGRFFLGFKGAGLLIPVLLLAAVMTALTNDDGQWQGTLVFLPGLTIKEAISFSVRDVMGVALPFLLGRAIFQSRRDLRELLLALVVFSLVYSFFILVEVRLSPQCHNWIYGYGQHDFRQTIRWGGYRPMVFMSHGLAVGLFIAQALIAVAALAKVQMSVLRWPSRPMVPYLSFILFLMKSLGALIFGAIGVVAVALTKPRTQLKFARLLAVLALLYPVVQAADILPKEQVIDVFMHVAPERAESLAFRIRNEGELVKKALERPWFGWGGYGRPLLWDTEMGKSISVTDGFWIIALGARGGIALAAMLLLMSISLLVLPKRVRGLQDRKTLTMLAGLAVLQGFAVLDLIPNGLFTDMPYFLGGALLSLSRGLPLEEHIEASKTGKNPQSPSRDAAPSPFDPNWMPNPAPSTLNDL